MKRKSMLKIYTSYVTPDHWKKCIEDDLLPIIIIRNLNNSDLLNGFNDTAIHKKELSPSNLLFRSKRDGLITNEEFKIKFKEELKDVDFPDMISNLEFLARVSNAKGIVLFSYGKDKDICHRSVISEILNNSNLLENEITEFNWEGYERGGQENN